MSIPVSKSSNGGGIRVPYGRKCKQILQLEVAALNIDEGPALVLLYWPVLPLIYESVEEAAKHVKIIHTAEPNHNRLKATMITTSSLTLPA